MGPQLFPMSPGGLAASAGWFVRETLAFYENTADGMGWWLMTAIVVIQLGAPGRCQVGEKFTMQVAVTSIVSARNNPAATSTSHSTVVNQHLPFSTTPGHQCAQEHSSQLEGGLPTISWCYILGDYLKGRSQQQWLEYRCHKYCCVCTVYSMFLFLCVRFSWFFTSLIYKTSWKNRDGTCFFAWLQSLAPAACASYAGLTREAAHAKLDRDTSQLLADASGRFTGHGCWLPDWQNHAFISVNWHTT